MFRVVAETEHLPTASAQLFVTAPALSRSIKLLEEALGQPLFTRGGRRLTLNPAGARLLRAVRRAMRGIDDAVEEIAGSEPTGPLRVSADGMYLPLAVSALGAVQAAHPGLVPTLLHVGFERMGAALLHGELDLALTQFPPLAPQGLQIERLARCPMGLYAGRGHPLADRATISAEECERHPFAAPLGGAPGAAADGWPPERPRHIALFVHQVQVAVQVCAQGRLLCVLPDPVVATSPLRDQLKRLRPRFGALPRSPLFAISRAPLDTASGPPQKVIEAVRARLSEQGFEPPQGRRFHSNSVHDS